MLETATAELTPTTLKLFSEKTRDMILESSLVLFNQSGFSNVTTASISNKTGILEGSLWYHFNTKKDILSAHIQLLEKVFLAANQQANSKTFETIIYEILQSYNLLWDFRYILRDNFQNSIEDDDIVINSLLEINNYLDRWAENRIQHSCEIGLLKINPKERVNLSEIILVLGRYWLDFSVKKYPDSSNKSLRSKGLNHIFMVLTPYIDNKAIPMIMEMLNQQST